MNKCQQLRIGDLVRIRNSQGHEYGRAGRVFDKHTYDTFTDYQFTLKELIYYLTDKEKGLI